MAAESSFGIQTLCTMRSKCGLSLSQKAPIKNQSTASRIFTTEITNKWLCVLSLC